jgi:Mg-chelatase subunit ChlD
MQTANQINLANLDVTVVVDKSGSMGMERDTPSGQSRWDWAKESILHLVTELGKYDDDGIDLIFFNASHKLEEKVSAEKFPAIWNAHSPGGGTVLAAPLQTALKLSENRWGEKNQLILVLTDGQPNDPASVGPAIIETTKKMARDEQIAILFLQVGKDTGAKAFLTQLDDGLESAGAKFDIVDSDSLETVAGKSIQDIVNKAFND